MSFGFDPIAFLTSLFAVWFAYNESKKSNNILIKVLTCTCTWGGRLQQGRTNFGPKLQLLIRNQGLSIHDPRVSLNFRGKDGFSRVNIPLKRRDERTGEYSEFARGMIAEYGLEADEADEITREMMSGLENPSSQDARLTITSQGYIATSIRVGGYRDRLRIRWNGVAYRFNRLFDRKIGERGLKRGNLLPEDLVTLAVPIGMFIHEIRPKNATDK